MTVYTDDERMHSSKQYGDQVTGKMNSFTQYPATTVNSVTHVGPTGLTPSAVLLVFVVPKFESILDLRTNRIFKMPDPCM